jgi:imidazolonepropionase-like amidohydrolase
MRFDPISDSIYILGSLWTGLTGPQLCPASLDGVPRAGVKTIWSLGSRTPSAVTAFVDVNVVPMDAERVLAHQTVLVEGGRITALGPSTTIPVLAGAVRIDGRGKYLIPGLADMHVHLMRLTMRADGYPEMTADSVTAEGRLFLWLANGVTTVRTMDYFPDSGMALRLRARAAAGTLWSPRIYASGALPRKPGATIAEVIAAYKAAGYDHIKVRNKDVDAGSIDSLAAAARQAGLPFGGHVDASVGIERAVQAGYRSIEHLHQYLPYLMGEQSVRPRHPEESDSMYWAALGRQVDLSKIAVIAAATKQGGVWNAPTQALAEVLTRGVNADTLDRWPEMRYVSAATRKFWGDPKNASTGGVTITPGAGGTLDVRRQLIKALQDSGAGLLLDSDAPVAFMVPGFATHRALGALVRSGLTPYQALATGTRNVAAFYGASYEGGTVAVGQRADLVLLHGNPLTDIRNTVRSAGVMIGGLWLSRAEIDRRLVALIGTL